MGENFKFATILICFLIALINWRPVIGKFDKNLLTLGLFFTAIADFFLVIVSWFTIGVFFFCFTHIFYIIRYSHTSKKIIKFLPLTLFPAFILFFISQGNFLIFFAAIYMQLFIISYSLAIRSFIKKKFPLPNNYLILVGMTLFVLCDICVLLSNTSLISFLQISTNFSFARQAIWFFYIPSQLFISLSGHKFLK